MEAMQTEMLARHESLPGARALSKAARRREKMVIFQAGVDTEKTRLATLSLSLTELVELFHCGNFFTELAAAHWVLMRNQTESEAVMATMLAGLSHPKWKVRRTCVDFMDHFGDQRCVEPLLRALKDPKEHVRRLALHSLCCQACKVCPLQGDFVPALAEVAEHDRSNRARRIATGTLGNFLHDARALATLQRLAEDGRDGVVAARAQASLTRLATSTG